MKNKRLIVFFLVIIALSLLSIYYPKLTGNATLTPVNYEKETAILNRVVDGDTIEVTGLEIGNKTHIRLLGINTPEKKMPFSNESRAFLEQFVNKTIKLERDKEDTDKYDRKLRYVYYEERFINQEILELGLANSYYMAGLRYKSELLDAEAQAKKLGIGVWTKSGDSCSSCIYLKELNATEEYFILGNNCTYYCKLEGWFVKDLGRNTFYLEPLQANSEKTYFSKNNTDIWNNEGDTLFIFDKKGYLVRSYEY